MKWFALLDTEEIAYLGEFEDFHGAAEASESEKLSPSFWIFNEDTARVWIQQLSAMVSDQKTQ
jgi:hypothetical protein